MPLSCKCFLGDEGRKSIFSSIVIDAAGPDTATVRGALPTVHWSAAGAAVAGRSGAHMHLACRATKLAEHH